MIAISLALALMGQPKWAPPWRGADVSSLPQIEADGGVFRDADGVKTDLLALMHKRGATMIRLRIWNNPPLGYCDLEHTIAMALRAKKLGLKVLLDFHYSDTWADPGHQPTPAAWVGQPLDQLCASVQKFSSDVVSSMVKAGAAPYAVQIGNEITAGMMWPVGQITGHDPAQYDALCSLIKAGEKGVQSAAPGTKIMLHIDRGGDNKGSRFFLDEMAQHGVPYDIIGLSYYPWWHGTLVDLKQNLDDLATRYKKPLVVVETSYPFTIDFGDMPGRHLKSDALGLVPDCPPTPDGQLAYVKKLRKILASVPGYGCWGVVWWEPGWIGTPKHRSGLNNLDLVDMDGKELPAFRALFSGL